VTPPSSQEEEEEEGGDNTPSTFPAVATAPATVTPQSTPAKNSEPIKWLQVITEVDDEAWQQHYNPDVKPMTPKWKTLIEVETKIDPMDEDTAFMYWAQGNSSVLTHWNRMLATYIFVSSCNGGTFLRREDWNKRGLKSRVLTKFNQLIDKFDKLLFQSKTQNRTRKQSLSFRTFWDRQFLPLKSKVWDLLPGLSLEQINTSMQSHKTFFQRQVYERAVEMRDYLNSTTTTPVVNTRAMVATTVNPIHDMVKEEAAKAKANLPSTKTKPKPRKKPGPKPKPVNKKKLPTNKNNSSNNNNNKKKRKRRGPTKKQLLSIVPVSQRPLELLHDSEGNMLPSVVGSPEGILLHEVVGGGTISDENKNRINDYECLALLRTKLKREGLYSDRDRWTECMHRTDWLEQQYSNRAFLIVMALIIAARESDRSVMRSIYCLVHKGLDTPASVAGATIQEIMGALKCGISSKKAKYIQQAAQMLLEWDPKNGGQVPMSYHLLLKLPGLGPKGARIIMQEAFNVVLGVPVDSHLSLIFYALGWIPKRGAKGEEDVISRKVGEWLPVEYHKDVNPVLCGLGQMINKKDTKERILELLEEDGMDPRATVLVKRIITYYESNTDQVNKAIVDKYNDVKGVDNEEEEGEVAEEDGEEEGVADGGLMLVT